MNKQWIWLQNWQSNLESFCCYVNAVGGTELSQQKRIRLMIVKKWCTYRRWFWSLKVRTIVFHPSLNLRNRSPRSRLNSHPTRSLFTSLFFASWQWGAMVLWILSEAGYLHNDRDIPNTTTYLPHTMPALFRIFLNHPISDKNSRRHYSWLIQEIECF